MNQNDVSVTISSIAAIEFSKRVIYLFVKRVFDLLISAIGIIFLVPITFAIKLSYVFHGDFYPVIYTHERIGKNGKLFKLYKFRSMVPNADEELKNILNSDKKLYAEYKKNKKLSNDPRITKIGKFIRKYSIDELPQLINVFIGNMSLIGNRPYLPREKKDMGNYYKYIILTKPGITGYWQVSGRNDISFKKRLQLEKYYSNNNSIGMDLKIFFKTFRVVLCGRGAK